MATTPVLSHMASALLPTPEGVLLNPPGSTVPAPYMQPKFTPPQAAFRRAENSFDDESRTLAEKISFDNSRTFISMQKSTTFSVSDISAIIPLKDLTPEGPCWRFVPNMWMTLPKGVHVINISVDDGIGEETAKEIILFITQQLDTPAFRLEGFNDIDISGMFTTYSRKGIEIMVYFHGLQKPDTKKFNTILQTIVKTNPKLRRLLNCKRPDPITARILLTNCLGITSKAMKASVSSTYIQASKPTFLAPPHLRNNITPDNPLITSDKCYLMIAYQKGTAIPSSFTAPTIFGPDKTMSVENLLEFSKDLAKTPLPNYKTALCTHFALKQICYHGSLCKFAHSVDEQIENANTSSRPRSFKTKMCPRLSSCPFGKNCHFAHKPEEIINGGNNNIAAPAKKIPPAKVLNATQAAVHPSIPVIVAHAEPALPAAVAPSQVVTPSSNTHSESIDFQATSSTTPTATLLPAANMLASHEIASTMLRTTKDVNNPSVIFPPFKIVPPVPVSIPPVDLQYKHSAHPLHVLHRALTSSFKCSVCREPNLLQGRHKCLSCDWNACQKCMDLDFLNTNRPVTVTNTATPTPKTPVFIEGHTSAPVPPSSVATAARTVVDDTSPSVPSSPRVAKRALPVSPQQPGGKPNTPSTATKLAKMVQVKTPPKAAKIVQLETPPSEPDPEANFVDIL